jgi:hypothetical protein
MNKYHFYLSVFAAVCGGRGHFTAVLYSLVPKHNKPTLRSLRGRLQPHPSKFDDFHLVVWEISLNAIDLRQAHTV